MVKYLIVLTFLVGFAIGTLITCMTMPEDTQCDCTVNVGNSTLTIEDAFEYVTKGLSAHQYMEVQYAINNSCECCK